jgi:hypothetical protein
MERCLAALLIGRLVKGSDLMYQGLFVCPEIKWPGFVPDRRQRRPGRKGRICILLFMRFVINRRFGC